MDWLSDSFLVDWAEWFIGLFQEGASWFAAVAGGIIPILLVLLTGVNALIALIGPERVNKFGEWSARDGIVYYPMRYLIWPVLSVFFLTNPMAYTNGQFLPEKYKPAVYDSAVSFVHPPLGIFPHVNPGELFVWAGIAIGIENLGLSTTDLAVRYLLTGFIVILMRGIVTEWMTKLMWARQATNETAAA